MEISSVNCFTFFWSIINNLSMLLVLTYMCSDPLPYKHWVFFNNYHSYNIVSLHKSKFNAMINYWGCCMYSTKSVILVNFTIIDNLTLNLMDKMWCSLSYNNDSMNNWHTCSAYYYTFIVSIWSLSWTIVSSLSLSILCRDVTLLSGSESALNVVTLVPVFLSIEDPWWLFSKTLSPSGSLYSNTICHANSKD